MKFLIYPSIDAERLKRVMDAAGDMQVVNVNSDQEAINEIADADGFFGKLTPELLANAQKLRWVQCPTASLEHYVFPELVQHACTLTNMRGLFSDVIAEHVFSYILCFSRNLHVYFRRQLDSHWESLGGEPQETNFMTGPCYVTARDRTHLHLSDCTLGIVGLGNIGAEIAQRGLAFGMRVVAVDPCREQPPAGVAALWKPEQLGELLSHSDFVVVAAPHTPETEGLFDYAQFAAMKPTAYFINIGRGVIVKLDGLLQALEDSKIAGAALDVFEVEPLPSDHPLWQRSDVIITPHVAACSPRIAERHLEVLLDNVARFAKGESLRNVASKEQWF